MLPGRTGVALMIPDSLFEVKNGDFFAEGFSFLAKCDMINNNNNR